MTQEDLEPLNQVISLPDDSEDRLILRPLSAKLLKPTTPELKGWLIEIDYLISQAEVERGS